MHRDVFFKCGHELTVRLFGNPMEIMAQEKVLVRKCVCQECALEEFGGLRECTAQELKDDEKELLLPKINGSWKQVHWAMTMRHQMLALPFAAIWKLLCLEANVLKTLPDYRQFLKDSFVEDQWPDSSEQDAICAEWYDAICRQTESTSWIAKRNNYGFGICNALFWGRYGEKIEALRAERKQKQDELLAAMDAAFEKASTDRTDDNLAEAEKAFDEWNKARKQGEVSLAALDDSISDTAEDEEDYWDLEREFDKPENQAEPPRSSRNIIVY